MTLHFSLPFIFLLLLSPAMMAAPVVGVDFSTNGVFSQVPDDLVTGDGITVSSWVTSGGGGITGDSSGNTGRASAPVGKFNGPTLNGTPPSVGSTPPTNGVHSFSITIDANTTVNLTGVSFDFSAATGGTAQRWMAFRTSLDTGLIYSQNGPSRPSLTLADLSLTGAAYQGLTNQTVTFYWYSGGEGTGDCDIDSIIIEAEVEAFPPTVTNAAAANIGVTTATLSGAVTDTGGADPLVTIFYGTTNGGTNSAAWGSSVALGTEGSSFSTDVTGLASSTTYFFRAFAENNGGSDWADSSSVFTTDTILIPAISNSAATSIIGTTAKVGGEVTDTGGSSPDVTLYWGNNDAGTNASSWDNSIDLGGQSGVFEVDLTDLNPLTTYFFRSTATNEAGVVWAAPTESFTTLEVQNLVINEFMAANDGGLTNNPNGWYPITNQVSGATDDWIEISNRSAGALSLDGWFLSDNFGDLTQWAFPAGTTVPANGFLIVYASGDGIPDANGNLHTNFRLSKGGEYLSLVDSTLTVVSEFSIGGGNYPNQDDDVSYGLHPVSELSVYFGSPTPGAANDVSGLARVADTKFNLGRGYYQTALDIEITTATLGATIYYTLDGSLPIDATGAPGASASVYIAAIPLTQTTAVRAAAVKAGFESTNVDCNTYVLLDIDNAAADGTDPAGLNSPFLLQTQPLGWGNLSSGDFNMDADVSQETATASGHTTSTAQTMLEGMRDIPTISIVMDRDDFSGTNGIYSNSQESGDAWERACSAEFIPAATDTRTDWQENCGLRIQGGASRIPDRSPKHGMSFRFREEYGASKLREPLFPNSAVDEFNVIAIRAGYNNSWIHNTTAQRASGSMIRDQWMRQTMLDMGNPAAGHGFLSHVFINGLYWGVHNLCERGDASHYAEHNGGDADLLDARNGGEYVNGNSLAFSQVDDVINTGDWDKIEQVLNVDQFIDYQLVNRYGANQDLSTGNNWRGAGGGPFTSGMPEEMAAWEIYSWDGERTMEDKDSTFVPVDPFSLRGLLENNADYQIRLADRVQKHFYGDGALTPASTEARWMQYAQDLDRAIIAESARWGDHRRTTPYTRDVEWLTEQNRLYTTYFPGRTATVLSNLTLPSIAAPAYLVGGAAQSEGLIPQGTNLTATGGGVIYYTMDGSDPRLNGGAISPNATALSSGSSIPISAGALVSARVLSGSIWSALSEGTYLVGPIADRSNLVISEFMYNPSGAAESTEFIELLNTDSSNAIDLSLVSFSGIDYTFPLGESLAPGESIVLVRDQVAFASAYNTAGMRIAPGEYDAGLSNDGEEIALIDALGVDAQRFTYNDAAPWPLAADGAGYSLTLIAPETSPDHSLPENWRGSVELGGSPGASDAEAFTGDALADVDGDGLNALLEYALGSSAGDAGLSPESYPSTEMQFFNDGTGATQFLTMSYRRNLGADDVIYQAQISTDLLAWSDVGTDFVTATRNGDGTETVTVRSLAPQSSEVRQFIRLNVSLRP